MGNCIRKYFFNLSGVAVFRNRQHRPLLETKGVHRYIRHPLYMGTLLLLWSIFLFFPLLSNLLACGMITLYTLIGIRFEEKKLSREFGESYDIYKRTTPMLIPRDLHVKCLQQFKSLFQR